MKVYTNNVYLCKKNEMKTLSLKLDDPIYAEAEEITSHLKIARNRYINEAVNLYNTYQKRRLIKNQLTQQICMRWAYRLVRWVPTSQAHLRSHVKAVASDQTQEQASSAPANLPRLQR